MYYLRGCLFLSLALVAMAFTPAAASADEWKQQNGYWYYWSDSSQRWYYQSGDSWLVFDNGAWVPTARSGGYRSYYVTPGIGGYVNFPGGSVSWGSPYGGFVSYPYGGVQWGYPGGYVRYPYGGVSWGGR